MHRMEWKQMKTGRGIVKGLSRRNLFGSALLVVVSAISASAEIRMPKLISDHAVLQRGVPIRIWGWASAGANLTVTLHSQKVTTQADRLGEWTAWLMPETAGGPYVLTVAGDAKEGSATVSDLLIGDVWVASGQSNMEMPLSGFGPDTPIKNGKAEIAAATNPHLRLLLVDKKSSDYPLNDISTTWTDCTPETAAKISAVGYFFARDIAAKEHVPVGLIVAAWGGVPVDSFISLDALTANSAMLTALANRAKFQENIAQSEEANAADKREDDEAKAAGKPLTPHPWHPDGVSWMPAGPYNGMIAPLTKYSVKGFIWYQGESDSSNDRAPHYADLFGGLITDWRSQFKQGNLPFLFVQLTSFDGGTGWGVVRDAQRRTLDLRNTAMAVTLDVGEKTNIHPADKQTVGARLALAARGMVYGADVAYLSPLYRQATTEPGAMRVWFDNAKGLMTKSATVEGFEIAGADHKFVYAGATIEGETVVVRNKDVPEPMYVRYAWNGIAPAVLYNAAGLPASTFTSETVPSF
jgi:sialate O-acetylesterase